ncbi:hypothetical protein AXF42_Ash014439 [Apostasia shenzhenica]|uniref:DUF7963 domain-containing protein n=1 Tax=Apostasia shenzhenica TaxID=1088818 RepID=A0A2H9ZWL8_9ASPA|nr:hypothetical protein AXF42_Ash014439 [Apostasia shenzhenica]
MAAAEATAKSVSKRYEALVAVRTKAMRGKGAWYWTHLSPELVHDPDSGLPIAVKLRCSLCDAVFSASNPSRTSSEHLKRGTCPNFATAASAAGAGAGPSSSSSPMPISSIAPGRKRSSSSAAATAKPSSSRSFLAVVDPSSAGAYRAFSSFPPPPLLPALPAPHHRLILSGGKEDLGALAMLEDSVKRLKSPMASPGPSLPKPQADAAVALLADWLLESGSGAASFSSIDHPKFRSFLRLIGLPTLSRRRLAGPLLNSRFRDARSESAARVHDALFFQLDSAGWNSADAAGDPRLISLAVNLPNVTTVFHRSMLTAARPTSDYAEEILRDAVATIAAGNPHRCAGIVADRFKSKALRNLESQNHWMVNVHCQLHGFSKLIRDFAGELPVFHSAVSDSSRLVVFFNVNSMARALFHKHQLQELNHARLLHSLPAPSSEAANNFDRIFAMLEDVKAFSHCLQSTILDDDYKLLCLDDPTARELAQMIGDLRFWNRLEAAMSLVKLVASMAGEMEAERPLLGQCLPLWQELRAKVKDWQAKFNMEAGYVEEIVERRFKKNYHPAMSAAFVLDPLYLTKDSGGKYLPPFKFLSQEQEKDVDRIITRLVSPEEAHIALMELMKWRAEGLDPLYAQAVQVKQRDPATEKMKVANPQSSRLVWETCLSELRSLGKVAVRIIFLHATACRVRCSPALLRLAQRSPAAAERVEKMVFVAAQARFERKSFSNEEQDAEIFGEDDEQSPDTCSL